MRNGLNQRRSSGVALVTVLVITAVTLALGYAALTISLSVLQGSKAAEHSAQARLNAESGIDVLLVGLANHMDDKGLDILTFTHSEMPKLNTLEKPAFSILTELPVTSPGPQYRFSVEGLERNQSRYLSEIVIEYSGSAEPGDDNYIPGISEIIQDLPSNLNIGSPSAGVTNINNPDTKLFIGGGITTSNFVTFRKNLNIFAKCESRDERGICVSHQVFDFNNSQDNSSAKSLIRISSPSKLSIIDATCENPAYSEELNITTEQLKFLCGSLAFELADPIELSTSEIRASILSLSSSALNKDLVTAYTTEICDSVIGCKISRNRIENCVAQPGVTLVTGANLNTWRSQVSAGETVCFANQTVFLDSLQSGGFKNINVIVNGSVSLRTWESGLNDVIHLSNSTLILTGGFSNQSGDIGTFHNANIMANNNITLPKQISTTGNGNIVSADGSIRIDGAITPATGDLPGVNLVARNSLTSYGNVVPTRVKNMISGGELRYDSNFNISNNIISYNKVNLQGANNNLIDKYVGGNILSAGSVEIRAPLLVEGTLQSLGNITLSPGGIESSLDVLNIMSGVISLKKIILNGKSDHDPRINVFAGLVSDETIEFNGTIRVLGPVYSKQAVDLNSKTIIDYDYLGYLRDDEHGENQGLVVISRR